MSRYSTIKAQSAPQLAENGRGSRFRPVLPPTASDPTHVRYRGSVRRVYGVVRAIHQGHKQYVLYYKRGRAPQYAHQTAVGVRGRARYSAVVVRADHVQPVNVIVRPTDGRPQLRKHRS